VKASLLKQGLRESPNTWGNWGLVVVATLHPLTSSPQAAAVCSLTLQEANTPPTAEMALAMRSTGLKAAAGARVSARVRQDV